MYADQVIFKNSVNVQIKHKEQVVYNQSPIIRRDGDMFCKCYEAAQLQAAELSTKRLLSSLLKSSRKQENFYNVIFTFSSFHFLGQAKRVSSIESQ